VAVAVGGEAIPDDVYDDVTVILAPRIPFREDAKTVKRMVCGS
jgi:hypothetical protein